MPRISYSTVEAGDTITAARVGSVFEAVADATDGTTGKIDPDNTASAAITAQHLAPQAVYNNVSASDVGSTTGGTVQSSGIAGAATAWVQVGSLNVTGAPTLTAYEGVLRWNFNLMIGDVTTSGGAVTKAQQVYYLQARALVDDGGGAYELDISPIFGYGLAQRSSNDVVVAGSEGDVVAAWTRNSCSGVIISTAASRTYLAIKLYFMLAPNDAGVANTVETCHVHASCFVERI